MRHLIQSILLLSIFSMMTVNALAETLNWTGCGITKKAFMKEMALAYEKEKGTKVALSGGGATKGIRSAVAGSADIGGSCRHWLRDVSGDIDPQEKDAEMIPVAWDALVAITHPDNPVDNITIDQLKQIYDGNISNWSELGGPDKPIAVITRKGSTSGVGYMMRQLVFADPQHEFKARSIKVKSTGPLEKKVEKVKTSIAIDGISSAKKRNVKFLSLEGIAPTKENISSGKYPLYRPLYLVVNRDKASKTARDFIEYVLSPAGQSVISEQGTVNLEEGKRLNQMWKAKKEKLGIVNI